MATGTEGVLHYHVHKPSRTVPVGAPELRRITPRRSLPCCDRQAPVQGDGSGGRPKNDRSASHRRLGIAEPPERGGSSSSAETADRLRLAWMEQQQAVEARLLDGVMDRARRAAKLQQAAGLL